MISVDKKNDVVEQYRQVGNATKVSASTGVSTPAVLSIVREAGQLDKNRRAIQRSNNHLVSLFQKINGGLSLQQAALQLNINKNVLRSILYCPQRYSKKMYTENIIPRLTQTFGQNKPEVMGLIDEFSVSALSLREANASIRKIYNKILYNDKKITYNDNKVKKMHRLSKEELREAAGLMLRDLRIKCGITIEQMPELFKKVKDQCVRINFERIERGDKELPSTVYMVAIDQLSEAYKEIAPKIVRYAARRLGIVRNQLKP